jgi:hypothetical protein
LVVLLFGGLTSFLTCQILQNVINIIILSCSDAWSSAWNSIALHHDAAPVGSVDGLCSWKLQKVQDFNFCPCGSMLCGGLPVLMIASIILSEPYSKIGKGDGFLAEDVLALSLKRTH